MDVTIKIPNEPVGKIGQESCHWKSLHHRTLSFSQPPPNLYYAVMDAAGRKKLSSSPSLPAISTVLYPDAADYNQCDSPTVSDGQCADSGATFSMSLGISREQKRFRTDDLYTGATCVLKSTRWVFARQSWDVLIQQRDPREYVDPVLSLQITRPRRTTATKEGRLHVSVDVIRVRNSPLEAVHRKKPLENYILSLIAVCSRCITAVGLVLVAIDLHQFSWPRSGKGLTRTS